MDSETPLDEKLTALAGALRTLRPSASRIDHDSLLYAAGRASVPGTTSETPASRPRRQWVWPLTTAVSLAIALASIDWRNARNLSTTVDSGETVAAPIVQQGHKSNAVPPVAPIAERPTPTYLLQLEHALAGNLGEDRPRATGGAPTNPPLSRDRLLEELLEETLL